MATTRSPLRLPAPSLLAVVLVACSAAVAADPATPGTSTAPASPAAVEALAAHDRVRAQVDVGRLRWSSALAAQATDWARTLCRRTRGGRAVLEHRPRNAHGENIFWQGGGAAPGFGEAVRSWADERRFFDAGTGQCRGGECRHYTQLVWRNTREVGCGAASCGTHHFLVCNYDPPGNYVGQRPY